MILPPANASRVIVPGGRSGAFICQSRIIHQAPRGGEITLCNHDALRQNPDRSFKHAHIGVEQDMVDLRIVEKRTDKSDENDIVGFDKRFQLFTISFDAMRRVSQKLDRLNGSPLSCHLRNR
jgi:hypothetical protein